MIGLQNGRNRDRDFLTDIFDSYHQGLGFGTDTDLDRRDCETYVDGENRDRDFGFDLIYQAGEFQRERLFCDEQSKQDIHLRRIINSIW